MNARFSHRTIATLLAGLLLTGLAAADYPLQRMDIAALTELLELDPYQAGEMRRILEAQRESFRAAVKDHQEQERDQHRDDHTVLKQRIQQARSEARNKLALVLRAEQLAMYEGFVQGRERHR